MKEIRYNESLKTSLYDAGSKSIILLVCFPDIPDINIVMEKNSINFIHIDSFLKQRDGFFYFTGLKKSKNEIIADFIKIKKSIKSRAGMKILRLIYAISWDSILCFQQPDLKNVADMSNRVIFLRPLDFPEFKNYDNPQWYRKIIRCCNNTDIHVLISIYKSSLDIVDENTKQSLVWLKMFGFIDRNNKPVLGVAFGNFLNEYVASSNHIFGEEARSLWLGIMDTTVPPQVILPTPLSPTPLRSIALPTSPTPLSTDLSPSGSIPSVANEQKCLPDPVSSVSNTPKRSPDDVQSVDALLQLFKTIGDQPINLQERRAELSTFLKQLLRDSNRFSYADIHDIIIPDLGYSSGQFGRNPSFASLVNDLVDQAIADNKLNLLVKAICRLKPHLFGTNK